MIDGRLALDHATVTVSGGVGRVTLTYASRRNCLSDGLVDDVLRGMAMLADSGVRIAVLDALPPVFCSGVDLRRPITRAAGSPDLRMTEAFLDSPIFWIASIDGPVLAAGTAVVALCPVVLATDQSWFSLPEVDLGIFPARVTSLLEPVTSHRQVFTHALTGGRMSAEHALRIGLITEVISDGDVGEAERSWVERLQRADARFIDAAREDWQSRFRTGAVRERRTHADELLGLCLSEREPTSGHPPSH